MDKKTFFRGFVTGIAACILTTVLTILAFLCPAWNPTLYDKILFLPMTDYPVPDEGICINGCKAKEVYFDSLDKTVRLSARLYQNKDAKQIILYTHGQGGNIAATAYKIKFLLGSGASVLAYDLP